MLLWSKWVCSIMSIGRSASFPGGQQQRTFLARALVQEAQIYFMDEPFAAVDAVTENAIVDILQALNRRGKTVLVVHHDLQTVAQYFDWLTLLNVEVVAAGPTASPYSTPTICASTYGGRVASLNGGYAGWRRGSLNVVAFAHQAPLDRRVWLIIGSAS